METATTPKKTALNQLMKDLNGKMVDFHGWELPIQFGGIISEHKAVRNSCGLFDVSHMGNIFVEGKDAHKFVQTINRILKILQNHYVKKLIASGITILSLQITLIIAILK